MRYVNYQISRHMDAEFYDLVSAIFIKSCQENQK